MILEAAAFDHREELPDRFRYDEGEHEDTAEGKNISPALKFRDVPGSTETLALVIRDIDSPNEQMIHWLMWNIDASRTLIEENTTPSEAVVGKNSYTLNRYQGPNPAQGMNDIWFDLYALDTTLSLDEDSNYEDFKAVIEGHVIDKARLVARCLRTGEFALE